MSVNKPLTYKELLELAGTPARRVFWGLEAVVYVNGNPTKNLRVTSQNIKGDFNSRFYGDHFVTLEIDPVTYRYMLMHVNKLEIELTKVETSGNGLVRTEVMRKTQRYQCHLTENAHPALVNGMGRDASMTNGVEQLSNSIQVHLQLIEPVVSDMRMEEVGGVFLDVTLKELLQQLLGYKLDPTVRPELYTDPMYVNLRGVDVIEPDNTERYEHIVIPNGTRLTHVPRYLQDTYGVYSSGLGWHIYRGWCFIYPLMNYTAFGQRKKTLTVLHVPEDEIPTMERTFLNRADQIYVFATGDKLHTDITERIQLNQGHGIRHSRASDLVDKFRDITMNRAIFNQSDKVKGYLLDERPNQKANVRFKDNHFSDNPFPEMSRMTNSLGTQYEMQWDNAAPELLYPGMQVKVLYKDENKIKELYGTLGGFDIINRPTTDMKTDMHFISRIRMMFFIARIAEINA